MTPDVKRAREIAMYSVVSSQPHVWEAMGLLVEMADEIERLREIVREACDIAERLYTNGAMPGYHETSEKQVAAIRAAAGGTGDE